MTIRKDTTKGCRRHQTMVASQFIGWKADCGQEKRAFRYATLRHVPVAYLRHAFLSVPPYQPLKWLATVVAPLRGLASVVRLRIIILYFVPLQADCQEWGHF